MIDVPILYSLSATFLSSKEKNLQLDFFREDGEVLLQVFKGYDVLRWGVELAVAGGSIVFQILFHKDKTSNDHNFDRFSKSELFNRYKKVFFHGQRAYFYAAHTANVDLVLKEVKDVLDIVYNLESQNVDFTLNAY